MFNMAVVAQPTEEGQKVIQQVFDALSGKNAVVEKMAENLQKEAWEALAYLEETDSLSVKNLREAVPDYYNFNEEELILKLIDPEDNNQYAVEIIATYRLTQDQHIELRDMSGEKLKDRWKIIYLDANYLALDMGDLRLFLTHTRPQE